MGLWGEIINIAAATLVGALIGVAGTILVNWLGNRKGYKDISLKIGDLPNTTLSGQHQQMEKELKAQMDTKEKNLQSKIGNLQDTTLNGQHLQILKDVQEIRSQMQAQEKGRLSGELYNIQRTVNDLQGFAEIMIDLKNKNEKLKETVRSLKQELDYMHDPRHKKFHNQDFKL